MFQLKRMGKSGQGMSEYLILVLLIAVGSIAAAKSIGSTVYSKLNQIHSELEGVYFTSVQDSSGSGKQGNSGGKGSSGKGGFGGVVGSLFGSSSGN